MNIAMMHYCAHRLEASSIYFIVNSKRIDLAYNKANLSYARATTDVGSKEEPHEVNVCGSEDNINLKRKRKLLLLWHQCLGHVSFRLVLLAVKARVLGWR